MSTRRLTNRKRRSQKVTFAWDPDDVPRLSRLQDAATEAQKKADRPRATAATRGAATKAQKALDDFVATIPTVTFDLVACGRKKAESLVAKNPPTPEQQKAHQEAQEAAGVEKITSLQYDPDRFPPALAAKCCRSIVLTHQDPDDDPDPDDPPVADDGTVTYSDEYITVDLFTEIFDDPAWSIVDVGTVFGVCDMLNQAGTTVNRDLVERLGNG